MLERLKQLRKALELSQEAFGAALGVKQSTIGDIESGKNKLSDRNFDAICRVYNVNPDWLRNGEGEMFKKPKDGLEQLKAEYHLTDEEIAIIQSYLDLPKEYREMVVQFARNFVVNMSKQLGLEPPVFEDRKPDDKLTAAEKRRIMNEELDAEEKGQTSYRSTGINGLKRKGKFREKT